MKKNKLSWLKGGFVGAIIFCIFFAIMSLVNTGKVSFSDAFTFKDPWSIFNYIIVLIFFTVGSLVGWIVGKIKSRK